MVELQRRGGHAETSDARGGEHRRSGGSRREGCFLEQRLDPCATTPTSDRAGVTVGPEAGSATRAIVRATRCRSWTLMATSSSAHRSIVNRSEGSVRRSRGMVAEQIEAAARYRWWRCRRCACSCAMTTWSSGWSPKPAGPVTRPPRRSGRARPRNRIDRGVQLQRHVPTHRRSRRTELWHARTRRA